jgi:anti-sigma regulatory factor (Ser/Thr protein kinase)
MCRRVIKDLTEGIEVPDDIAMLAVRAVGLHDSLDVEVPADAEQLATVRHLIRRWVTANGGSDDDCAAFAVAVTEACANAVEHAYGPGDAMIDLSAELHEGAATVTVRDRGGWREPRGGNRGRGIPVMNEFMDDVAIETGEAGTTVTLMRQVGERG